MIDLSGLGVAAVAAALNWGREAKEGGTMRWWQFGLFGGVVLSLATGIKVTRAVVRGALGEAEWGEAVGFGAAIFGMGFLCGVIVWAGKGLYQRTSNSGWPGTRSSG